MFLLKVLSSIISSVNLDELIYLLQKNYKISFKRLLVDIVYLFFYGLSYTYTFFHFQVWTLNNVWVWVNENTLLPFFWPIKDFSSLLNIKNMPCALSLNTIIHMLAGNIKSAMPIGKYNAMQWCSIQIWNRCLWKYPLFFYC